MRGEKATTITLSVLSLGAFLFKIVINILAGLGYKPFDRSVANVSDKFALDITPAGWAFSIWGLIYLWNFAYLLYALSTECRDVPPVLNGLFYLLYIACDIANVAWLYVFTSENVKTSAMILVANQIALYLLLYVVYINYSVYQKELEQKHRADAMCLAVLVENGIMLNTAWVTVASLLNIGMVITYCFNFPMPAACALVLAALLVICALWFYLENFRFQPYLNNTYADWPVILWALAASLAKNWDLSNIVTRITLALLVIVAIMFIARIVLQVIKNKKSIYFDQPLIDEKLIHLSL